jgi:hypothetical protein
MYADKIRDRAAMYVREARSAHAPSVVLQAGQIIRDLHLVNRAPAVCSALASKKFQQENGLVLERTEGPKSGMSTTTRFHYRFSDPQSPVEANHSGFWDMRGAGKDTYKALGGGEEFLTEERASFEAR